MATERNEVDEPQDWDKAVNAAYLWLIMDEVKGAAEGAGVGERTMHRWIRSEWWYRACAEAEHRWLNHITAEARRTVAKAIRNGDSELAWQILQRRDRNLAPKPQEHRVSFLAMVGHLPASEIARLEALPDDELAEEIKKIGPGG